MARDSHDLLAHPAGEQSVVADGSVSGGVEVDSFCGPVRVEWDHDAPMTPHGQLAFFVHYLKMSGVFDALVADCPRRYLFKLRLTKNVKRMLAKLANEREWTDAGQGFEAKESEVRLEGWSRQRRTVVLRRRLQGSVALAHDDESGAAQLSFADIGAATEVYEYQVLVTSLDAPAEAFGQLYRDRGDAENIFDEMKNQWGWSGFTTRDLARCRLSARLNALVYNWWNIFVRLADPDRHREAIVSRPLFLSAIATRTRHARQTTLRVASSHAKAKPVARALEAVAEFLRGLAQSAEQLAKPETWRAILSRAFQAFLQGRLTRPPPRLASS